MKGIVVAAAWTCALLLCGCKEKERASVGSLFSEDGLKGNFEGSGRPKERKPKNFEAHVQPPPLARPPRVPPPAAKPEPPPEGPAMKKRPAPSIPAAKTVVPDSPRPKAPGESARAKNSGKDDSSQRWEDPERPDEVDPGQGAQGSRYLSPAKPKDQKVKVEGAEATAKGQAAAIVGRAPAAGSAAPDLGTPPAEVKAEAPQLLTDFSEEDGSYRVQISDTEDFKRILFDKTYPFLEDFDVRVEMRKALTKGGHYWVRSAFIDLLEFQHPFSKPKHYYVRHKDLFGP